MAQGGVRFSSDDIVIKSPNDKRLYRYLEIHNGLSALLVHDPQIHPPDGAAPPVISSNTTLVDDEETSEAESMDDDDEGGSDEGQGITVYEDDADDADLSNGEANKETSHSKTKKAAAAMCVGMGSLSDPYEAQGLAHFLEHMLFMGSMEFPDENEYDSYLSKHGGSSNAYTEMEYTCYHFDVEGEFLYGALRRFSQFFISPLVKNEAMERELLAVDSEFNQILQSDVCRLQQLQCYTSVSGHPFNKFFWGNKKSLTDAMEKGVNLREQILKLYGENYYGGLMKLVVIGGESLDVLENWVLQLFTDVKKGPSIKPESRIEGPIWNAGKIYRLEAVKDVNILDLSWKLPCLRREYLKKPEDYLAHLLGHEGRGSLHFFLKNKGWVTSISAGVEDEGMCRSSIAYVFGMSIRLTDIGFEKVYCIIGFVYQYIKLLRLATPKEWIFKELQAIGNMEFRFAEEQPQDDYATELAENLLVYPAEHVIYGEYAYRVWDEEMTKNILNFLTPENMRIDVISKSFDKSGGLLYEPWFGARYTEEGISPHVMELWRDPPEVCASLHLPLDNEFIPTNFFVHADNLPSDFASTSYPKCILDEPLMKLWYKLDETFKLPRANTYFRINLMGAYESVTSCLLTELSIQLLKDALNEIIYQASIAKLETSVSVCSDKLELKVFGFNDKLPLLLSKILSLTKSFLPRDDRVVVIKEDMERDLRNTNMKPLNHAQYLRLQLLCKSFWDVDEKLHSLKDLSLPDLLVFIPKLLSQLYIEGLCHGNLLEEEAINISNIFRYNFSVQPVPVEMRHEEHILCLPSGANLVRDVCVKNKLETNSVVELYYQLEQESGVDSIKLKAFSDLFDEIVQEPLFNQLRTKEQLGYVVKCSPRMTYRVSGFCFCVQSSQYNPIYLQDRIDNFIDGLEDLLDGLDDESFESFKSGLIARLMEKDPSLIYETNRFWSQIVDRRYMFDSSEKEAREVRSIKKRELIGWYNQYFHQSSPKCRRLAARVWGCNTAIKDAEIQHKSGKVQVIDDLMAFKMSSNFYPSIC
ncbi:hypothetical protein Nepgr_000005 [Nepenthes gracilis]|uniref:Nardilysin n=1 Tax=Nepenthes gracilis TaxID=150966 RepID=A0AAD3P2J5_NEPGR|nr:hypothetical protein Nepgr_000005 [Nepenthes gracilis]